MRDVKITWDLPTQRSDGFPLTVDEILHAEISTRAAGGTTWAVLDTIVPPVRELTVAGVSPGDWEYRGVVVLVDGKVSPEAVAPLRVPSDAPPEAPILTVSLV